MNGSKKPPRNRYLVDVCRSWYSLFLSLSLTLSPTYSLFILQALCSLRYWVVVVNKISLHLHGVYFQVRTEAEEPGIHNPKRGGEEGWQGIVL